MVAASKTLDRWAANLGDTIVGTDVQLVTEKGPRPEIDLTYDAKVPTSGAAGDNVDHEFVMGFLKSKGRSVFEVDAGDYAADGGRGFDHSAELTLKIDSGVAHPDSNGSFKWRIINELDGASAAGGAPAEAYEVTTLRYRASKWFTVSPGIRLGITPYTSKAGVFVSVKFNGHCCH